ERDIEAAANDVRDAVSRIADRLPDEADAPEVHKADSDSDTVVWLNMSSTTMDTMELSDYAERYVEDRLSSLDGVSQVRIGGRQGSARCAWLDSAARAGRGISRGGAEAAVRAENAELPPGRIAPAARAFPPRVARQYRGPAQSAQIPVRGGADGYVVPI